VLYQKFKKALLYSFLPAIIFVLLSFLKRHSALALPDQEEKRRGC
jgi:hypothetical protein